MADDKMSAEELDAALREMPECADMLLGVGDGADLEAWGEALNRAHRAIRAHITALQREADEARAKEERNGAIAHHALAHRTR